jgi:hypothetical protein
MVVSEHRRHSGCGASTSACNLSGVAAHPGDVNPTTASPGAELEALYRSEHRRMVRVAYLLTVSEELVHDAFLRVAGRLASVDDPAAYLRTVVVNLTRAHHRRRDVERRHAPVPPGPALPPDVDETWAVLWQLPTASGRRSSCATTPTSPSPRSPPPWAARSAPPSRSCTAGSPASRRS